MLSNNIVPHWFCVLLQAPLRLIKNGLRLYPSSLYMLLCLGELYCQASEAISAIKTFKKVNKLCPHHPLPYLNASRVYQQLNQQQLAMTHMEYALAVDPTFTLTRVELAQHYLHIGQTSKALHILDGALDSARHVSEIKEVLTARTVAQTQLDLQRIGLVSFQSVDQLE